ncbi:MAG TPA: DUF4129 domain-containing protein [Gaiellales bacterium]|jgi:heme exporter protein D|nr:DUF4129 domain-containing protein [Gaiellales bacterium]
MGARPDHTPPGPLSPARTAILTASLLGLLVVVSLATRSGGHRGSPFPGGGVAGSAGHHAFVWLLLVAGPIAGILGIAFLFYGQVMRRRDEELREALRQRTRKRLLVFSAILIALVVFRETTGRNPLSFLHVHTLFSRLRNGSSGGHHPTSVAHPAGIAAVDWALAGLTWLALVALAVVVVRRMRRRRLLQPAAGDAAADPDDDAAGIDLDALRAERDPRRAVIAAYAAMDRVMARNDLGRERWEAPLEYLGRMTAAGFGRIADLSRLTRLYARARFSTHPIDRSMQAEAVAAVAAIAAEDGE